MKAKIIIILSKMFRFIRGEVSTSTLIKRGLKVGKNFGREGGVRIDTSYCFLIDIGDNVTLAPNVTILAHDASLKQFLGLSKIGIVKIGNNVFVGAGSIILPDTIIGDNVIIGAGSVVTKNVASNSVIAGNPARLISNLNDLKNKNIEIIKKRPLFDRSYSSLNITNIQKSEINNALKNGFGYFQCENFDHFQNK